MMRAAQIVAPQQAQVVAVERPAPATGEVLVKIIGCGVCASNLAVWQGQPWLEYPQAPGAGGHEAWGEVVALGSGVAGLRPGQRVALLSNRAYAEYDCAPAGMLLPLPEALADQPFPAEPLGCAMNILRRSALQRGETVAIVGIGFLGLLLTQLASNAGARVLAITRRPWALELARQFGAAETIVMDEHWQVIEQVKALSDGRGCACVIEAVGKQAPLDLAGELTAERGRLVVAGYHQDGPRQVNMQLWNWRGLDVINAHERDPQVYLDGMRAALDAVLSGTLTPAPLYTHRFGLEQLGAALQATHERPTGFMKALVLP